MKNLIEVKHLSKHFPSSQGEGGLIYALQDIHLEIPRGCIYGIIGMSGAGKSTLLRCLTGLEIPSQGSLSINGKEFPYNDASALGLLRKQMGMVFQHFQLFSSRTVEQNIAYPLEIAGLGKQERLQRVAELLPLVGLDQKRDCHPSQLSGGEKQRVGIARALASHPSLLLCDEPTSALDPKTTRDLLNLLYQLNQKLGLTIIIITHQLDTVKQICERVAVLAHGQIVEEGTVLQIFTQPQHPVTQHLLHLDADQFPPDLLGKMGPEKCLIRLGFEGSQAKKPIISQMIKHYAVDANILSGNLDYVQKTMVGHLFIELTGIPEEIEKALAYLNTQHIICEVMG